MVYPIYYVRHRLFSIHTTNLVFSRRRNVYSKERNLTSSLYVAPSDSGIHEIGDINDLYLYQA